MASSGQRPLRVMGLVVAALVALAAISSIGACGSPALFGNAPSIDRLISTMRRTERSLRLSPEWRPPIHTSHCR
jgi:hypothetical protein